MTANTALVAFGAGFAGWALENIKEGPRYSAVLPDHIPFLPIYAAGGATVAVLAPRIKDWPILARFAAYAGTLTALEAAAGYAERSQGRKSWDYNGSPIDLPHSLLWGALGLLTERIIR